MDSPTWGTMQPSAMLWVLIIALAWRTAPGLGDSHDGDGDVAEEIRFHYMRFPQKDALCEGSHLQQVGTTDVEELKAVCDKDADCRGFNSRGVLKRDTRAVCIRDDHSSGSVLYSKTMAQISKRNHQEINVIPLPTSFDMGKGNSALSPNFTVTIQPLGKNTTDFVQAAVDRYYGLVLTHRSATAVSSGDLTGLEIRVLSEDMKLGVSTNESYQLTVPGSGVVSLEAATVYGAVHGLETLSQLIKFDYTTGMYHILNTPISVDDQPRFPHRGVLLDTSRHYHSVPMLKGFLDSMSHAKFNVFHWHIVDLQSFPMHFHSLPSLVKGAFTPLEIYTPGDVADIVQYAQARAIRIVPEFDMPSHAASWCVGYPEVCPSVNCTMPLNPATNKTFDLILTLLQEATELWPDEYFHLGADEVHARCWETVPAVAKWLKEKNYTTDDAYKYFVTRTHQMAHALGRRGIFWDDVFDHFGAQLDKDVVFEVWRSHKNVALIVAAGYQCILSNFGKWYLDHVKESWKAMYLNDPLMGITDPAQQKLMLGGEACMWGETVDDSDLFNTVWPRAAAIAERLWSPASANNTDTFLPRLVSFRCLLNHRGYAAAAVNNTEARSAPPGPGSCTSQ